jgi:hypothetical protein
MKSQTNRDYRPAVSKGQAMIALRKRGNTFYIDLHIGRLHAVRGTLGTEIYSVAARVAHRTELALAEGPRSTLWTEIKPAIPNQTFAVDMLLRRASSVATLLGDKIEIVLRHYLPFVRKVPEAAHGTETGEGEKRKS